MTGPLHGLRVLELGGIGPGPHAAMLLADLGADVVRVERPATGTALTPGHPPPAADWMLRGRRAVAVDLKDPAGQDAVRRLLDAADVCIEGFRPGVAERLGIGPAEMRARNPRLVYVRMTGWGQDGPLADRAGHDLNYIGLTGALHASRVAGGPPVPPLNLLGDFGGGSTFAVIGVLAALWERERSGQGQVIDAAILDGTSVLLQMTWTLRAAGVWSDTPASNLLDTGAPFYATYACADGGHLAVASLEPRFYALLLAGLGLDAEDLPAQGDQAGWPVLRERFAAVIATRTRDEWTEVFAGTDACVTPVLAFGEVAAHPQVAARGAVTEIGGVTQAGVAPRFSRSVPGTPSPPPAEPVGAEDVLAGWSAPPA